ncbi:TRAM domain-containing protein [Candidatus Pelagibacter sp.]|nr:TRAM domain-containing protein [Candidatus Pelagibacter sp.]
MLKKIFIKTFGCQMNEYDSNRIFDTVKEIGFEKTDKYEDANCYLLNTCHIRDKAKEKVYHEIGRVKKIFRSKLKPIVIVAGCVAQAENQEMLKREPYIDIVIGPQSYHKINEAILKHSKNKKKEEETEFDTISKFNYLSKIKNKDSKVSSFLTIQEGCDKFCHFCVVPYTRGPEYSRPFKQIIDEAKELIEKIGFINSYSFIFSARPGTVAADLTQVNAVKSKERLEIIQKRLFENQIKKNKSLENKILNVLVENIMKDGIKLFGRTEYMTSVIFDGDIDNIGKIVQVEITSSNQNSLFGKLVESSKKKVA